MELTRYFFQIRHTNHHQVTKEDDAQHHLSSGKWKSKSQWNIQSYPLQWLYPNRQEITSTGRVWKKEIFVHSWWQSKLVHPLQKTVWIFFNTLKIELLYDPAILLLGILQFWRKWNQDFEDIHTLSRSLQHC